MFLHNTHTQSQLAVYIVTTFEQTLIKVSECDESGKRLVMCV